MKKFYFISCTICMFFNFSAQEVIWQKDINSSTQDFLTQITPTIDQQYLITGSSINLGIDRKSSKRNNGYDYHLIKINQQGNQVWEKYFSGLNHDFLSATTATQEGGFVLAGTSYSDKGNDKKDDSKGGSDIWLIKINEFGDEIWQKTLGSALDEEAKAIIQTSDLGFFVAGNTVLNEAKIGYGSKEVWVIRLDKNGKEISQSILGGLGLDEVEKMIPTKDGGALLGIYSRSDKTAGYIKQEVIKGQSIPVNYYLKRTVNEGEGDYWVIKLNKNGIVEWEMNYGGKGDDHLRTLALTPRGYLIGGESRSEKSGNKTVGIEEGTDLWLISLNERGEEYWQKSYNFKNRDVLMGMSILNSADDKTSKGILLGGYTQSESKIENNDETFWITYLNEDGDEQWRKYVKGESRKKEERLSDIKINKDGSILLAGTSAEELGKEKWKIVKLSDKQIDQLIGKAEIKIYPNPVSDYAYVEIGLDFNEADIILYDMGGRQVQNIKTKNKITKLNTQPLVQGAYLIVVETDKNKMASAKIIKK